MIVVHLTEMAPYSKGEEAPTMFFKTKEELVFKVSIL